MGMAGSSPGLEEMRQNTGSGWDRVREVNETPYNYFRQREHR